MSVHTSIHPSNTKWTGHKWLNMEVSFWLMHVDKRNAYQFFLSIFGMHLQVNSGLKVIELQPNHQCPWPSLSRSVRILLSMMGLHVDQGQDAIEFQQNSIYRYPSFSRSNGCYYTVLLELENVFNKNHTFCHARARWQRNLCSKIPGRLPMLLTIIWRSNFQNCIAFAVYNLTIAAVWCQMFLPSCWTLWHHIKWPIIIIIINNSVLNKY